MSFVNSLFNSTIRPFLPPKQVQLGGVEAFAGTILDRSLDDLPDYEQECRAALRQHITPGDNVRIVGGGYGVSAVVALQLGAETVEIMEATREGVNCCRKTIQYNTQIEGQPCIADRRWRVHHGVVGELVDGWGIDIGPSRSVDWCRNCDVLELDAEGAERAILRTLDQSSALPGVMIVESHGYLGSPTDEIRQLVIDLGYEIVSEEPEEADKDVVVLTALRSQN